MPRAADPAPRAANGESRALEPQKVGLVCDVGRRQLPIMAGKLVP